jgi:hypothetical protein
MSIIATSGMILESSINAKLINDCLSVSRYTRDQMALTNYRVLAGFMIDRKYFRKYRLDWLRNVEEIDFDYSKIKFYVSPELFVKGSNYRKIGSFITKHVVPVLQATGVEMVIEPPQQFFNNGLGTGYGTEKLEDYVETNAEEVVALFKETFDLYSISSMYKEEVSKFTGIMIN